jgi:hypothetical protein
MESIDHYIARVAATAVDCREIWLIGSRASGTANPDSDWDLLVFGGPESYARLRAANELHRGDVDCLVVVDGDEFQSAWGSRLKSGTLSKWRWDRTGSSEAHYIEAKWQGADGAAKLSTRRRRAVLKWRAP